MQPCRESSIVGNPEIVYQSFIIPYGMEYQCQYTSLSYSIIVSQFDDKNDVE